jgi:pimeloyl-ACP methyl ester carboxylesterase
MVDYVLVHGGNMSTETWNRLTAGSPVSTGDGKMGARIWDGTVSFLEAHRHRAFAPALTDENRSHLAGHIGQVCSLIAENTSGPVILVGHSYGGMVITGVADAMRDRIGRLVYVDAALPDPGQSLYDILNEGLLASPGCQIMVPEPAPPYVEKLQFDETNIDSLPGTCIFCTKSEFAPCTRVAREKIAANGRNWTYVELPSSHVPMADMPDEFNQLLLDAADLR